MCANRYPTPHDRSEQGRFGPFRPRYFPLEESEKCRHEGESQLSGRLLAEQRTRSEGSRGIELTVPLRQIGLTAEPMLPASPRPDGLLIGRDRNGRYPNKPKVYCVAKEQEKE